MLQSRLREGARLLSQNRCKAGFAPDAMERADLVEEGQKWQGKDRKSSTKQMLWIAKLLRRVG